MRWGLIFFLLDKSYVFWIYKFCIVDIQFLFVYILIRCSCWSIHWLRNNLYPIQLLTGWLLCVIIHFESVLCLPSWLYDNCIWVLSISIVIWIIIRLQTYSCLCILGYHFPYSFRNLFLMWMVTTDNHFNWDKLSFWKLRCILILFSILRVNMHLRFWDNSLFLLVVCMFDLNLMINNGIGSMVS